MKGCFVLQRRFAYISHYLAQLLKEQYGVEGFCGITATRQSYEFLMGQKDVHYSTLLLDEDIHERYVDEKLDPTFLEQLEQEYGIPYLWPILAVDRVIMSNQLVREYPFDQPRYSHEDMLRLLQVSAKAIIALLDTEKPDFLFVGPIGSIANYLLYRIAQKRGVRCMLLLMTSTHNRYILSETYDTFSWVNNRFRTQRAELATSPMRHTAIDFLQRFREKPFPYFDKSTPSQQPVSRSKQLKFLHPLNAAKSFAVFSGNVYRHLTRPGRRDYSTISPWNYLKDLTKRKTRNLIGVNDLYDLFTPDEDAFVFFPLHYEPEISLLLQAPYQTDQLALIRQIARSLPVRYKLYVKDHPEMVQYRPRAYYQALKKNPNVKLIDPSISSFAITPKAKLVATITGSTGWEAVLLKKPVISFGHQFYNELTAVTYCADMETLPSLIKERLKEAHHDEAELIDYLTALFEDSAELNLHHLWMDEPNTAKKKEGLKPLADLLAKKLGLIYSGIPL